MKIIQKFYTIMLQKSGYISTSDTIDVNNSSTIQYEDSVYNNIL